MRSGFTFSIIVTLIVCAPALAAPPTYTISGVVATDEGLGVEGVDVVPDGGIAATTTAADGSYSITVPKRWTGVVTVSKTGWLITPALKTYSIVTEDYTTENYTAYQPQISGIVTKSDGTPLAVVSVTADNGGGNNTTDATGYYELSVPYNWSGTVSATLAGYYFTDKIYSNVITDQVNQDFSGYQPTISGSTGVTGATVTVSGVGSVVSSPAYSVTVPYDWSGTITAELVEYNFTNSPLSYANVTTDLINQYFTPYQPIISGTITKENGTPLDATTITADNGGGSTTTDTSGHYEIVVPYDWSGQVKANKLKWDIMPESYSYVNVIGDQSDQDFVASYISTSIASTDSFGTGDDQFEIDFITISGDTNPAWGFGIVNNDYRVGTYEITNDQFAKFAVNNPSFTDGGVPANEVSWLEAAQFVNFLNTSTGNPLAYKFSDGTFSVWDVTDSGYDASNPFRNSNAKYFLPTEDEWVKAAYWNGTSRQTYATTDGLLPEAGVDANYDYALDKLWSVGSGSKELNGTYDMMGNVFEWLEGPHYAGSYWPGSDRCVRGGSYVNDVSALSSSKRYLSSPDNEFNGLGFRVASVLKYGGGDGTEENPYLLSTASHLQELGATPADWAEGLYFSIVADIDMSAYTGTSFNIIGADASNAFHGYIAGNNHTISNFTYSTTDATSYIGLFGCFNGQLTDLLMSDVSIDAPNAGYVGGIAGYLGAWILRCGIESGTVTGNDRVGGLAGRVDMIANRAPAILGSYSKCAVNGNNYTGGIAGSVKSMTIQECYSNSPVSGNGHVGGLLGQVETVFMTIKKCYASGPVSASATFSKGGLLGTGPCKSFKSYWDIQTTNCSTSDAGEPKTTVQLQTADTFAGWGCSGGWTINEGVDYPRLIFENQPGSLLPMPIYGGGSGTQEDPYLIYTAEHFSSIGEYECHNSSYYKLMADIELSPDPINNFVPIGYFYGFTGSFDGNHHVIINPYYDEADAEKYFTGLFAGIGVLGTAGKVENLGLIDPNISSASDVVGGLCGFLDNGTIQNCFVRGGSISGVDNVGGLVGAINRETNQIQNCYTNTSVSGQGAVAGLAGSCFDGIIESCYAAGPVVGVSDAGGLAGYYSAGQINNSYYDEDTTGQTGGQGTPLPTLQMQMMASYSSWDFVGESVNGENEIWRMCVDGVDYPRLSWEFAPNGDFACDDGVDIFDLEALAQNWLATVDNSPTTFNYACDANGDEQINLEDFAVLGKNW